MTVFVSCPGDRVFINEASLRREYGDIYYVSQRFVYADEIEDSRLPPDIIGNLKDAASRFDPAQDFLLIAGDYLQMTAFGVELAHRYGKFKMLRYDKKADGHLPVWVGTMEKARVHGLTAAP